MDTQDQQQDTSSANAPAEVDAEDRDEAEPNEAEGGRDQKDATPSEQVGFSVNLVETNYIVS